MLMRAISLVVARSRIAAVTTATVLRRLLGRLLIVGLLWHDGVDLLPSTPVDEREGRRVGLQQPLEAVLLGRPPIGL